MEKRKLIEVFTGGKGRPDNYKKLADETYRRYGSYSQMGKVLNEILSEYFKRKGARPRKRN